MKRERPVFIQQETNMDAQERIAQRLKDFQRAYDKKLKEKAYPYIYKDNQ